MSDKVKFEISVATKYVKSKDRRVIEIDREDLEGIPESQWEDYVWEELGGDDVALEMCYMGINRVED